MNECISLHTSTTECPSFLLFLFIFYQTLIIFEYSSSALTFSYACSFPVQVIVAVCICISIVCFVPPHSSSHQPIPISLFSFFNHICIKTWMFYCYFPSSPTHNCSRFIFSISPYLFLAFACGLSTFCLLFLFIASCKKKILKHKYWFGNKGED